MKNRGATPLAGILLVDKPAGITSHDVVAAVRRATGEGRIGHGGTLDPIATGLLVVLVGPYARLAPYLTSAEKSYEATIAFGTSTDTDDAEGIPTETLPVPDDVFDPDHAREVLARFVGPAMQLPPIYSAIKKDGRTSYKAARSGDALVLESRPIEVFRAELLRADRGADAWDVDFVVSKGTYVRALARDIGRACGTAAHLASLRRLRSGNVTVEASHNLEEVVAAAEEGRLEGMFADPLDALGLPTLEGSAGDVRNGRPLALPDMPPGLDRFAVTVAGRLAAVYRLEETRLVPEVVLPSEGTA